MHNVDDLVVYVCGLNEHVDRHNNGFDGVHGKYIVGQRNL